MSDSESGAASTLEAPHVPRPLLLSSGHASWLSGGAGNASLVVFGGQAGTSPQAPFLGDTWAWPLEGQQGAKPAWTQLQSAVFKPSTSQPDARAVMAVAPPRAGGFKPALFGGFSGYNGGLNDLLLNDTWSWEL